jgi:hypothetical protein
MLYLAFSKESGTDHWTYFYVVMALFLLASECSCYWHAAVAGPLAF